MSKYNKKVISKLLNFIAEGLNKNINYLFIAEDNKYYSVISNEVVFIGNDKYNNTNYLEVDGYIFKECLYFNEIMIIKDILELLKVEYSFVSKEEGLSILELNKLKKIELFNKYNLIEMDINNKLENLNHIRSNEVFLKEKKKINKLINSYQEYQKKFV